MSPACRRTVFDQMGRMWFAGSAGALVKQLTSVAGSKKGGFMLQFIHPVFGDLMVDGIGLAGFLFALFLMWEALKEWRIRARRARNSRERAKGR